ncbi:hypothetical protein D9M72_267390 [compost metagenome]
MMHRYTIVQQVHERKVIAKLSGKECPYILHLLSFRCSFEFVSYEVTCLAPGVGSLLA